MYLQSFVLFLLVILCNAFKDMKTSMNCNGTKVQFTEEQMLPLKECSVKLGIEKKDDLTMEKAPCFAKCIFEQSKLVDKDGHPHKESIPTGMVASAFPENIRKTLQKELETCLDDHGMVNAEEPSCQTYVPLAACIHMAYIEICQHSGM